MSGPLTSQEQERADFHGGLQGFFRGFRYFFLFCLLLGLAMILGSAYVVYLLLAHFGVVA